MCSRSGKVIEKAPHETPPLYSVPTPSSAKGSRSKLRRFIALPEPTVLVLGARRTPPVAAPAATPNTNSTIAICTSVGFRPLDANDFAARTEELGADMVVGLGDVPYGRALGSKRIEKAVARSEAWLREHVRVRRDKAEDAGDAGEGRGALFASLLPVTCAKQRDYVDFISQELVDDLQGLAVYDLATLEDVPETLHHFPRLGFTEPQTPQQVLQHITRGLDLVTIPFITTATDAGIALFFTFPAPTSTTESTTPQSQPTSPNITQETPRKKEPLGHDLCSPHHATSLTPLTPNCPCYACTNHHRAYISHLLNAKEMLGWTLLQLHNHAVIDAFFSGVRYVLAEGVEIFEREVERFEMFYEDGLPERTGKGPRVRGYQYRSEGPGEKRRNEAPFTALTVDEGREKVEEALEETANGPSDPDID